MEDPDQMAWVDEDGVFYAPEDVIDQVDSQFAKESP